jgi:hypothetical protein
MLDLKRMMISDLKLEEDIEIEILKNKRTTRKEERVGKERILKNFKKIKSLCFNRLEEIIQIIKSDFKIRIV